MKMPAVILNVTEAEHVLFTDFAAYTELPPYSLFNMFLEEQCKLSSGLSSSDLLNIDAETNGRLGDIRQGRKPRRLLGRPTEDTHLIYQSESSRLDLSISRIARVAVMHGFILEMDAEHFSF